MYWRLSFEKKNTFYNMYCKADNIFNFRTWWWLCFIRSKCCYKNSVNMSSKTQNRMIQWLFRIVFISLHLSLAESDLYIYIYMKILINKKMMIIIRQIFYSYIIILHITILHIITCNVAKSYFWFNPELFCTQEFLKRTRLVSRTGVGF